MHECLKPLFGSGYECLVGLGTVNFENIMRTEVRQYDVKCHGLFKSKACEKSLFIIIRTSKCLSGKLFGGPASGPEWGV